MYRLSQDVIVKQRGGIYFGLNMKTGTTYEMNESQFDIVSFFSKTTIIQRMSCLRI